MNLKSSKFLIAWITLVIYATSACAFIAVSHCCSGHSHLDGEAHEDHDHLAVDLDFERISASEHAFAPNGSSFSHGHCCGQGLHGEGDGIALHAANCQRSTEPNRFMTWLSLFAELSYWQLDSHHAFCGTGNALFRASARSPALESILTVSLLI
jgi:hypothetical protein